MSEPVINTKKSKKVEIYVKSPCLMADVGVKNDKEEVELSLNDIKLNLVRGNKVWEIIEDKRVALDMENYDKDNTNVVTVLPTDGFIPISSEMLRAAKAKLLAKGDGPR